MGVGGRQRLLHHRGGARRDPGLLGHQDHPVAARGRRGVPRRQEDQDPRLALLGVRQRAHPHLDHQDRVRAGSGRGGEQEAQGGRGAQDQVGAQDHPGLGAAEHAEAAVDAAPLPGDGGAVRRVLQEHVQGVGQAARPHPLLPRGPDRVPRAALRAHLAALRAGQQHVRRERAQHPPLRQARLHQRQVPGALPALAQVRQGRGGLGGPAPQRGPRDPPEVVGAARGAAPHRAQVHRHVRQPQEAGRRQVEHVPVHLRQVPQGRHHRGRREPPGHRAAGAVRHERPRRQPHLLRQLRGADEAGPEVHLLPARREPLPVRGVGRHGEGAGLGLRGALLHGAARRDDLHGAAQLQGQGARGPVQGRGQGPRRPGGRQGQEGGGEAGAGQGGQVRVVDAGPQEGVERGGLDAAEGQVL
mmetsp:Transcript_60126/g.159787  ORF Transcript_60126/g.159787 Transcript_60126/m.159787 type:complete len:414 (+) Transcript_60126:676-1917(+)